MQTPLPLKKSHFQYLVQKVAQCSETNEKLIFLFLDFETWSLKILRIFWIYFFRTKRCSIFWNGFFSSWIFFLDVWYMVDFVLNIRSELVWGLRKNTMLGGLHPPNSPGSWGTWPPTPPTGGSALRPRVLLCWIPLANWLSGITGYSFWIRFAKISRVPNSLRMLSTK